MGTIVDRVKSYIPASVAALTSASYFGLVELERIATTTKFRLFATVVAPDNEDTTYNEFVLDYAAKVMTLRLIPTAADYWADQLTGETTNEETISYPDRIDNLWKIHERLLAEVYADRPFFESQFPGGLRRTPQLPRVSTSGELVTPDPARFGSKSTKVPFGCKESNMHWPILPWADWG
jgi:hypothetical protein